MVMAAFWYGPQFGAFSVWKLCFRISSNGSRFFVRWRLTFFWNFPVFNGRFCQSFNFSFICKSGGLFYIEFHVYGYMFSIVSVISPEAEFKALLWLFRLLSFIGCNGPYTWLNLQSFGQYAYCSLEPRSVRAIRVTRGGLEPSTIANFPDQLDRWRRIRNRRGRLGTRLWPLNI